MLDNFIPRSNLKRVASKKRAVAGGAYMPLFGMYANIPIFFAPDRSQTSQNDVCATRDLNVWSEKKRLEKLTYMHNNPVKRCLVAQPDDWPWSSFRFYLLDDASLLKMDPLP